MLITYRKADPEKSLPPREPGRDHYGFVQYLLLRSEELSFVLDFALILAVKSS